MSTNYFKLDKNLYRLFASLMVTVMVAASVPAVVFAADPPATPPDGGTTASSTNSGGSTATTTTTTPPPPSNVDTSASSTADNSATASSTNNGTAGNTASSTGNGTSGNTASSTASSTPTTSGNGSSASSTDDGTSGTNSTSTNNGTGGTNGSNGTESGNTATSTPPASGTGQTGSSGPSGTAGGSGTNGGVTPEDGDPVEVDSDILIGDPDVADTVEVTGSIIDTSGQTTFIETGIATARAELFTDANSNDVQSQLTPEAAAGDLDIYTFIATGTNDAIISNDGAILSSTGDNALDSNIAEIITGDSVSAFNIANIINTNVVNSEGLIYLGNKILGPDESLDLTDTFFPEAAASPTNTGTCSLLSCAAEDIVYNLSQTNTATVTNKAVVEATTGFNQADSNLSSKITTGDAFASANVMNVINTNIIDSNYQLLTFNAIGDLEGDLILPTEELFTGYFSQPNGLNQLEQGEVSNISVTNNNDAVIGNNLSTYGQTGNNNSTTYFDSAINTGMSETESNILNKVNTNIYGGDSFYIHVRIHGYWAGDVVGLPAGLTWDWTPEGIIIYNIGAEISPSEILGYDIDSYSAQINNQNDALYLDNDLTIKAITGENTISGLTGNIETGDAFASANVMNIANTNVIGTNWTYAVINILGDLDGNVSFTSTDLSLSGSVASNNDPASPGDTLTYDYTVTNNSTVLATNVVLEQILENAQTSTNQTWQSTTLSSIAPGASMQTTLSAIVDSNIPLGASTTVTAYAKVTSDIGDKNFSDNLLMLTNTAFPQDPSNPNNTGTTSTTTDPGNTGTTTDPGDTSTTTDPGDGGETSTTTDSGGTTPPVTITPSSSGGGGGGGGGSSSRNRKVDREVTEIDPSKQPLISIKKIADITKGKTINAGEFVDYTIIVTNKGGTAYDSEVFDVLTNPIGSEMNTQSWDLGTIIPGEEIKLTYTTEYDSSTPSGVYTNTASIKAYLDTDTKATGGKPLNIKDAVYKLEIKGVALAVGNVATIAFFPSSDGQVSALMAWETSTSSVSKIYYGPYQAISQYDADKPNLGYQKVSLMFPDKKTTHYMVLMGLKPGVSYGYRVYSQNGKDTGISQEHTFVVPYLIDKLTLAYPATPVSTPRVAGASTIAPAYQAPKPVLAYVAPAPKPEPVTATPPPVPAPKPVVVKTPLPAPEPIPATEPEPEPELEPEPEQSSGGFFGKVVNFFRW